jgi:hypothetical protein
LAVELAAKLMPKHINALKTAAKRKIAEVETEEHMAREKLRRMQIDKDTNGRERPHRDE